MYTKKVLFSMLFLATIFVSCSKEFTLENEKVSGKLAWTQKSFTPVEFDNLGKPTKAKIVQEVSGSISTIGEVSSTINVDYDVVSKKSGKVETFYTDKDGDKIYTTSSSIGSATGITINETITSGTGKFAKITGSGTYFINMDFTTGNGTGTLEWTVTY